MTLKRICIMTALIICCATVLGSAVSETAQTPQEDETASYSIESGAENAAQEAGETALVDTAYVLNVGDGEYLSATLLNADQYMTGLFSAVTMGFNTGQWDIKDAVFSLRFSTTQLVSQYLSTITISINGVRFYSENVPVTDGLPRQLSVQIPAGEITEGYNVIAIEGYIRTYNGYPCVDDVTSANWMNVFEESYVEIAYQPSAPCAAIDEFYTCFTSIDALENAQSAVVLDLDYDDDELAAALITLAGVSGQATKEYQNIELLTSADPSALTDKRYVIYISKSETTDGDTNIAEMNLAPGSPCILTVTAATGEGLKRAAAVLSNPTYMQQFQTASKTIGGTDDIYINKESVPQYTQITETGTCLDGAFRQEVDYYIDFPNNRKLAYGSEIALTVRYSKNLDFSRSLVTAYVNDVPVGSEILSMEQADGHELTLTIPTDIDVVGSFTLTIAFDLEIEDLWCTLRQSETPWAYISSESLLKLNSVEMPYYLFDEYPYPFISDGEFNQLVLLLPREDTDVKLDALGKFMLTLGQFLQYNTGEFTVARADNPGELDGQNVIAMGTYQNNSFIASLNEYLFFQYDENGDRFLSNEKLLIDPEYGATLAAAQLIESPFSDERRAILVLSACDADELDHALYPFGDTTELWSIYGDGFVTDGNELYLYRFKEDNQEAAEAVQSAEQKSDIMNLTFAAGAVLILLIIASVLMVVRYRRKSNEQNK